MPILAGSHTVTRCRIALHVHKLALCFLLISLFLISLCGCGGNGFTDGGIPNGRSVVMGQVVHADDPLLPVANATVTIVTSPQGTDVLTYRVITGADGSFAVNGVQVGPKNSNMTITMAPNDATLQQQKFTVLVTNNQPVDMIIAAPPASLALTTVAKISVTQVGVNANGSVQLETQVLNSSGNPLMIVPTMIFDGSVGTVNPDGTFTVTGLSTTATTVTDVTGTIDVGSGSPPTSKTPVTVGPTSSGPGSSHESE